MSNELESGKMKLKEWLWLTLFSSIGVLIWWYESSSRSLPLDDYNVITGTVVGKGEYSGRSGEGYFVRIKNNSGNYKFRIDSQYAPDNFLELVKDSSSATAKTYRSIEGIKLVELQIDTVFVVKRK